MGEERGWGGMMVGGGEGLGKRTDITEKGEFLPKERSLTAGEGGLFPRGVVVGHVRGGDSKDIRVDLAMLTGQLSYVRLKPIISIAPPEENPVETELSSLIEEEPS